MVQFYSIDSDDEETNQQHADHPDGMALVVDRDHHSTEIRMTPTLSIGDWLQSVPSSIPIFHFFLGFSSELILGIDFLYLELILELIVGLIFWYWLYCVFCCFFWVHICSHLATQVAKNKYISTKSCIYIYIQYNEQKTSNSHTINISSHLSSFLCLFNPKSIFWIHNFGKNHAM